MHVQLNAYKLHIDLYALAIALADKPRYTQIQLINYKLKVVPWSLLNHIWLQGEE